MFITLEGGEGAGKSTQARLLARALAKAGHEVIETREPGGSPGAELLRELLLRGTQTWSPPAEAHLHFAARAEHLAVTVLPALASGSTVICDRFADSTLAYQGYGQGADKALIRALTQMLPRQPDLTLMLRVSPAVAAARMAQRHQTLDRYEAMDAAFHARVAAGFAEIAAAEPARCLTIDADGDLDTVHQSIIAAVLPRLAA